MEIASSRPSFGFGVDFIDEFIGNDVVLYMRRRSYGQKRGQNQKLHDETKVDAQLMFGENGEEKKESTPNPSWRPVSLCGATLLVLASRDRCRRDAQFLIEFDINGTGLHTGLHAHQFQMIIDLLWDSNTRHFISHLITDNLFAYRIFNFSIFSAYLHQCVNDISDKGGVFSSLSPAENFSNEIIAAQRK